MQAGVKHKNGDNFKSQEIQIGIADTLRRPFGILETRFIHLDHQAFDIGQRNRVSTLLIPGLRWTKTTTSERSAGATNTCCCTTEAPCTAMVSAKCSHCSQAHDVSLGEPVLTAGLRL